MSTGPNEATSFRFDPYAYETHEDPYPMYQALRDDAPAYIDEEHGFWALSRHADVRTAIDDWRTFSSTGGITLERRSDAVDPMLIEMDPPRHTEMRALVSRSFTPRRVAEMERPTRDLARELLVAAGPDFDAIGDFAGQLPMAVISTMLGIPRSDQDEVREWSDAMLHREEGDHDITPAGIHGATNLHAYLSRLVEDRRREPRDDMTSALVAASDDARALTGNEVLGFLFLLVIAGNETTTKLIGNALYWLWKFPDQRQLVLEDPALIPMAVEEILRFDTSTQGLARLLTRDLDLHGVTIPAGMKGLLLFGSANRDERQWDRPDELDVSRNPAGHLAFGHGIHHCLGAALARLETRVALEELLPHLGRYEIDAATATRVHSGNVRGFAKLPISAR
ncbi:MAG: cytochrome P450 [Acidimicrobiia bacterium]